MSETETRGTSSGGWSQLRYMPALDGVRALSILGIMANHGGFAWANGGVISVNVFFVLSGFLITLLLMREWARSGTLWLRAFWARRARRLLPALFVLLGAIGLYIIYFAPDGTQSALRGDGLGALFYFSNWHQIFTGQSYVAQVSAQSPLLHTWTLSIEEQFYVLWPIIAIIVLKLFRSPRALLIVAVAGVVGSATEMALLFHPHIDPSRLYYGTDTRAQDILTGAAFGILLYKRPAAQSVRARIACSSMVVAAVAVFAFEWSKVDFTSDLLYRGGFLLADVMVALVICGVTLAPSGLPARLLSFGPLTFVGRISYGLYLWHWPVFLVLDQARTGLEGWTLFRPAGGGDVRTRRGVVVPGGDAGPSDALRELALLGLDTGGGGGGAGHSVRHHGHQRRGSDQHPSRSVPRDGHFEDVRERTLPDLRTRAAGSGRR